MNRFRYQLSRIVDKPSVMNCEQGTLLGNYVSAIRNRLPPDPQRIAGAHCCCRLSRHDFRGRITQLKRLRSGYLALFREFGGRKLVRKMRPRSYPYIVKHTKTRSLERKVAVSDLWRCGPRRPR